jgi:uncharacterized membrane protein
MNCFKKSFIRAKGIKSISMIVVIVIALFTIIISTAGCGNNNSEPILAAWVTVSEASDTVSIPVSVVNDNKMVHFLLEEGSNGEIAFMVYELNKEIYVRSNVCPPCRSVGFSLQEDILVCDTCATTFNAKNGDGIKGACVDFPKASVPYEIEDETIIMKQNDLIASYQNTIEPGQP